MHHISRLKPLELLDLLRLESLLLLGFLPYSLLLLENLLIPLGIDLLQFRLLKATISQHTDVLGNLIITFPTGHLIEEVLGGFDTFFKVQLLLSLNERGIFSILLDHR